MVHYAWERFACMGFDLSTYIFSAPHHGRSAIQKLRHTHIYSIRAAMEVHPRKVAEESTAEEIGKCPTFDQMRDELKQLCRIGFPVTVMNLVMYLRAMVSVLCTGRLGSLELAGGALAVGFTNITGYSVLYGLATGMDPVCGQAFGSRNWALMGLALQRTTLILLCACIPIGFLWLNLKGIMLSLGQDPGITEVASLYCRFALPDLLANSVLQPLRVYLRSQGITAPMMWCSFVAVVLHVPLSVWLVFVLKLGVPGVAIATWWTNLNMAGLLVGYLLYTGAYRRTWVAWSAASLREWRPLLNLALPSCLGVCLEWWWFELMTLFAGYLPNPRVTVATAAIVIQTTSLMYAVPMALGLSVSTRVGNELGAGRPARARTAAIVAIGFALLVALLSVAWTTILRHFWGRLFTDDRGVLALTRAVLPIVGLCELGNCPHTTGCGVLRGSARPAVGARINLGSFYFVGTPVALVLAFLLRRGLVGLCYGLLAAQIACTVSVLYEIFLRTDWAFEAARAQQLGASSEADAELGLLTEPADGADASANR